MTTITQTITALPDGPDPSADTPDTFSTKAAARVLAEETMVTQINTWAGQANTVSGEINSNAVIAAAGAVTATEQAASATSSALTAVNAPGTSATSTTSDTIALGSTTITIQTGKSLVPGMWVISADSGNPGTNYMAGPITAYDSGTGSLTFTATVAAGSGTLTAWTISLTPIGGASLGPNTFTARQTIPAIQTVIVDKGTVGTGTVTFDGSTADYQRLQVSGALTIAFSNIPSAGTTEGVVIELVNGGSATVTMPTCTWIKSDGSTSATFADMGVTLQTSGTNWLVFWLNTAGTLCGKVAR